MSDHANDYTTFAVPGQSAHADSVPAVEAPAEPPYLEDPAPEPRQVNPASGESAGAPAGTSQVGDRPSESPVEASEPAERRRGRPKRQDSGAKAGVTASEEVRTSSLLPLGIPPASSALSTTGEGDDDDPFSPRNLAIAQNFSELTETKRLLTNVRVGKPSKEAWVRTSTDPDHWVIGSVVELKDQGDETYWLTPAVRDALIGEPCLKAVRLILAVDRPGNPFFWKIALPDPSGRSQPWVDSMVEAATVAKSKWVRVNWSNATRSYEVLTAEIKAEPKWPTESRRELLNIAFRGRIVTDLDHPVLRDLRGQD